MSFCPNPEDMVSAYISAKELAILPFDLLNTVFMVVAARFTLGKSPLRDGALWGAFFIAPLLQCIVNVTYFKWCV